MEMNRQDTDWEKNIIITFDEGLIIYKEYLKLIYKKQIIQMGKIL